MRIKRVFYHLALLLGFTASLFFTLFLITEGILSLFQGKFNVIPILLLMMISVLGFVWTFMNPDKGSITMIAGGIGMSIYLIIIGGFAEIGMALIFGLSFFIPGLFFRLAKDVKVKISLL